MNEKIVTLKIRMEESERKETIIELPESSMTTLLLQSPEVSRKQNRESNKEIIAAPRLLIKIKSEAIKDLKKIKCITEIETENRIIRLPDTKDASYVGFGYNDDGCITEIEERIITEEMNGTYIGDPCFTLRPDTDRCMLNCEECHYNFAAGYNPYKSKSAISVTENITPEQYVSAVAFFKEYKNTKCKKRKTENNYIFITEKEKNAATNFRKSIEKPEKSITITYRTQGGLNYEK